MDIDDGRLSSWASSATHLFATDSGADRMIRLGFSPVVVGDFDSFESLPRASHLRLEQSDDQDTTDCDKLLALVGNDGHGAITLIGTEGDLPDHVVATYSSCVASALNVRIAFRRGIGYVVKDSKELRTHAGQRVSLLPLLPCEGVHLEGVVWPLEGATLAIGARTSVSNEATGAGVTVRLERGAALLFLETNEVAW
jgi:thiamine pyrophosphokinase